MTQEQALNKLFRVLTSRKFWAAAFAIFASYGLEIDDQTQAIVLAVVAVAYMALTAYEDASTSQTVIYELEAGSNESEDW